MTSFLERLRGQRAPEIARQPTASSRKASNGDGWLTAYQQGGINLSSLLDNDPQAKAKRLLGAYKVGWFNKAERKISTDFANLAISVAPEDDSGDNEVAVIEPDLSTPWEQLDPVGRFLRLMEKPNRHQTGRQLRQKTMIRLDMAGWCFWYTELGTDRLPVENGLYGISPARLWPSYDKTGMLIGYVLDKDRAEGGVPFEVEEIIPFSYNSADDDLIYGVGVVEAIWAQIPLTDLMAKHVGDVLTTGGRLAGAMWPKDRALDEAEFEDAKRAWRNVASDPNAGRRLLLFPEPMEWSAGASTPQEIGIPELAALNRDDILTSFPISPYQLGVPMPGGLNSAETRKEDRLDYWMNAMHPRVELFEETVQTHLLSRYEEVVGYTLDFEVTEPNLDDAPRLIEKAGAMKALVALGFDAKDTVEAVGLDHIKWTTLPDLLDPAKQAEAAAQAAQTAQTAAQQSGVNTTAGDSSRSDRASTTVNLSKAAKGVEEDQQARLAEPTARATERLNRFFADQRKRVERNLRQTLPQTKAERRAMKSDPPDWWDSAEEDALLTDTMRGIYLEVGRSGLQGVSDTLERTIGKGFVQNVYADLLEYGGQRVKDINERTLQALVTQLAEGARRGYSIPQLIDGVADEGFGGVAGVTLDNGVAAFDDLRAETIARTETMLSFNRATVTGYGEFGVTTLLAYDGDKDEVCASRNGVEFSILDAQGIEDHPNGTLAWSPVVDKAVHDGLNREDLVAAFKAFPLPVINVYNEPGKPPEVHVEAAKTPDVHVDVHVPESTVNVAAAEAPVVNITTPEVTVLPTVVNVTPTLAMDPLKAEVTVKAEMPAEMRITSMPDRLTRRQVKRDKKGVIVESTDVEMDA